VTGLRVDPQVLLTELGDGTGVLLHLGTKFYYTLNETGVVVWKALVDGQASLDGLASQLAERFRVTTESARGDVSALLDELEAEHLVRA
jgi:hypothetical protein